MMNFASHSQLTKALERDPSSDSSRTGETELTGM